MRSPATGVCKLLVSGVGLLALGLASSHAAELVTSLIASAFLLSSPASPYFWLVVYSMNVLACLVDLGRGWEADSANFR